MLNEPLALLPRSGPGKPTPTALNFGPLARSPSISALIRAALARHPSIAGLRNRQAHDGDRFRTEPGIGSLQPHEAVDQSSPAPTSRTRVSAISATTSAARPRARAELPRSPEPRSATPPSARDAWSAGGRRKAVQSPPPSSASPRRRWSRARSPRSVARLREESRRAGRRARRPAAGRRFRQSPRAAGSPRADGERAGRGPAPSAARIASSRPRAAARAIIRLETLAQAISRTRPTAPCSTSRACLHVADELFANGPGLEVPRRRARSLTLLEKACNAR